MTTHEQPTCESRCHHAPLTRREQAIVRTVRDTNAAMVEAMIEAGKASTMTFGAVQTVATTSSILMSLVVMSFGHGMRLGAANPDVGNEIANTIDKIEFPAEELEMVTAETARLAEEFYRNLAEYTAEIEAAAAATVPS